MGGRAEPEFESEMAQRLFLRYHAQAFSRSIHCSVQLVLGPLLRGVKLKADHEPISSAMVQKPYPLSMVIRHMGKFIITQSPSQFATDSDKATSTAN
jgi:hypothetical protein